jgi:putative intracellular protease/amidase
MKNPDGSNLARPTRQHFKQDAAAQKALANTLKLADMKSDGYDTVFYGGGDGPMWDLAESPESIALLESFYNSDKPIALVCHSPGVLRHVPKCVWGRFTPLRQNGRDLRMDD